VSRLELFGTAGCPYTAELREELEWQGREFVYHDVEQDGPALIRMLRLTGGHGAVPVLVDEGRVEQIGYRGRACMVSSGSPPTEGGGR
jgi:mycoredoxin